MKVMLGDRHYIEDIAYVMCRRCPRKFYAGCPLADLFDAAYEEGASVMDVEAIAREFSEHCNGASHEQGSASPHFYDAESARRVLERLRSGR